MTVKRPQNGHRRNHNTPPTIVRMQRQVDGSWYARRVDPDDYPGQVGCQAATPGAALDALLADGSVATATVSVVVDAEPKITTVHELDLIVTPAPTMRLVWHCKHCGRAHDLEPSEPPLPRWTLVCRQCGARHGGTG